MTSLIYDFLTRIGYHHPLHPPMTHLPVGLVMGAAILALVATWRHNSAWEACARRCLLIALAGLLPTVLTGLLDWQHFYGGAWILPIQIKMGLAAALLILLTLAITRRQSMETAGRPFLILALLALFTVTGLGYFGGELVYKKESRVQPSRDERVRKGESIFAQNCAACHLAQSTEARIGPGLKDLFRRDKPLSSGWPATEESIRRQLNTPFAQMPSFAHLPPDQQDALVAYLKTL